MATKEHSVFNYYQAYQKMKAGYKIARASWYKQGKYLILDQAVTPDNTAISDPFVSLHDDKGQVTLTFKVPNKDKEATDWVLANVNPIETGYTSVNNVKENS